MNIHIGVMCHLEEDLFRLLSRLRECREYGNVGVVQVLDDFSGHGYDTYVAGLCTEYGFRFQQRKLDYDFSAQRNYLMSLLPRGDFIGMLDADEMVPPYFFTRCAQVLEQNPEADALSISRKNVVIGYDGSQRITMERHPRVFKNLETVFWNGTIHEGQVGLKAVVETPIELEIEHVKTEARCTKQHNFYKHWYDQGKT